MTPSVPIYPTNSSATFFLGKPNCLQIQQRIRQLSHHYLSQEQLNDRLDELPQQFLQPQPRRWKVIDWQAIALDQIVGIELPTFLAVLKGSINTEAPIRGYTQTSRRYLENLHPQLARFVGGTVNAEGELIELGLWEKEERQHAPALMRIYTQLSGEKLAPDPHAVRQYQPSQTPRADLYRHGLHRVLTEYGATCLYLWLMAHTTDTLHLILEELVLDEINHMTKFWGFGVWAYPETSFLNASLTLLKAMQGKVKYSRDRSSLIGTLDRMSGVLNWPTWSWQNRTTFAFTCLTALHHLHRWNRTLTRDRLNHLFGTPNTTLPPFHPSTLPPERRWTQMNADFRLLPIHPSTHPPSHRNADGRR
jgi:hypothetical protein